MKTFLPVFILLWLAWTAAPACECNPKPSVKDAFAEAKVVFVGRCMSAKIASKQVKDLGLFEYRQFGFEVTRVWKGRVDEKKITISTGEGSTDCGVQYALGESYIVYASVGGGELSTNVCRRGCVDVGKEAEAEKKELNQVAKTKVPPQGSGRSASKCVPKRELGNEGKA